MVQSLPVYRKMMELTDHLYRCINDDNFPIKDKKNIGDKILDRAFCCIADLVDASNALDNKTRFEALHNFTTDFTKLTIFHRFAYRKKLIPIKQASLHDELIANISLQIKGWSESVRRKLCNTNG